MTIGRSKKDPAKTRRAISLLDGTVSEPERGVVADEVDEWRETDLESALGLAPELLGLGEASPVTLRGGGGGPAQSPDQTYVDSMQRLHVVEIKKGEAGLDAIAQVLAYGDMHRMLPQAAFESDQAYMLEKCQPQALLDALRRWAKSKSKGRIDGRVSPRKYKVPRGLSARHIVVAKSFSGEAISFAKEVTKRGTSLELLQATMRRGDDTVQVDITPVFREPWIEATWSAFRMVWSSPRVQAAMEFVGWAEPVGTKSFSLALKKDRRVRLGIEIDGDGAWLWTMIPDKYFLGKPKPSGFLKPLPRADHTVGRYWYWHLENLTDKDAAALAGRIAERLAKIFPTRS